MKNLLFAAVLFFGFVVPVHVFAMKYYLKDGRMIEGTHTNLSRVDEVVGTAGDISRPILVIDDGLRLIYLSRSRQLKLFDPSQTLRPETFKTGHSRNDDGKIFDIPGNYSNSTPFDKYGLRLLKIHHSGGIEHVEQAIVELTPYYVNVTSRLSNNKPVKWDMRIATNAIPREEMTPMLLHLIDPQNIDDRKKLVRFYYNGGLYGKAEAELESILQDWEGTPEARQLSPLFLSIRQDKYEQILDELELRWESGQYEFVHRYITALEQHPQLPDWLLEPVRRFIRRYDETEQRCQEMVTTFKDLYEQLPEPDKNEKIPTMIADMERELNMATLRRLASFELYANDERLSAAEKLAIGITGWYAGANAENSRLAVAVTLPETEKLIVDYLRSGHDVLLRERVLEQLKNLETSRPDLIAGILATMKPPFSDASDFPPEDPAQKKSELPGYYRLTVPNPLIAPGSPRLYGPAEIQYAVQLPPGYNPHLRYPMIVSLNGSQTPEAQLDWWAGEWRDGERTGHATRYGYIVIAPDWNPPAIKKGYYDFSLFSHAAVLASVKDAFRRFSVNTDRVFLSGHGDAGGTAAWDMGLAHPDLWAGVIPFNAIASKYINAYEKAVRHVPLYLVWGEKEGVGQQLKWNVNARILNKYLQTQARPGDVTVVRYQGRGLEGFSEEILHILEWMKLRQRTVVPTKFEAETLRPWDSFFWWVEMSPNLLADQRGLMIDPIDYPARGTPRAVTVESELYRATNRMSVTTRPGNIANIQVFLTPEMIDFNARTTIRVNDKPYHPPRGIIEPDIEVMLEDTRTRGDRLHPFWARLDGK